MLRKFLVLASLLAVLSGSAANADTFYTQIGAYDQTYIGGGGGVIAPIQTLSTNLGASYTNSVQSGAPVLGNTFRAVGAAELTTVNQLPGGSVSHTATPGAKGIAIFALEGTVTSAAGLTSVQFNTGKLVVVEGSSAIPFFTGNPLTWQFNVNNIVAEYSLKPQEPVETGNPLATNASIPAEDVNSIDVNIADQAQTQGRFIFRETTDLFNAINNLDTGLIDVINPFANGLPVDPADIADEGLFVDINERLQGNFVTGNPAVDALFAYLIDSQLELDELNRIATALGLANLGGANTGFATAFGNGLNQFNNTNTGLANADFGSQLQSAVGSPGIQLVETEIPEPASLAIWGLMSAAGLGYMRRRKTKAAV